jgi:hypothetical protein
VRIAGRVSHRPFYRGCRRLRRPGRGRPAELSQAVGKARPRDRLAGLLVHDHDIHLRLIDLNKVDGEAVEERAGMKR